MPKVTVAMPVYNDEEYLQEAIDSILTQTFTDFELLIINDGSTDGSMDIVAAYNDPRIRIINFEQNKGRPFARNAALDFAKGEYLAWMDSDDISLPHRLEKQVVFMDAHPDIILCGSAMRFFNGPKHIHPQPTQHATIQARTIYGCTINNPTAIMRLADICACEIRYRTEMLRAEDYSFWIDALIGKNFNSANLKEPLLEYRYFHRPTSRAYHVQAVHYLLEYFNLPNTEENALKHTVLSFGSYTDEDRIPEKQILAWANVLYESLSNQKKISYSHAVHELHIRVEIFLANTANPLQFLAYYRSLPLGKSHSFFRLLGILFLRKIYNILKK